MMRAFAAACAVGLARAQSHNGTPCHDAMMAMSAELNSVRAKGLMHSCSAADAGPPAG